MFYKILCFILVKPDQELSLATFGVENDKEVWPSLENLNPQQKEEKKKSTTVVTLETKSTSASGTEIVSKPILKSEITSDTLLRLSALNTNAYNHYLQVQGIILKALNVVNQNDNQAQDQNENN